MHYQVVVFDDEIGQAMEIESIAWKRFPSPDDQATFTDLDVYLGLCDSDELENNMDNNFIPGTMTSVLSSSSYTTDVVAVGDWYEITFTTPYWYNGQENLLIEINWSAGSGSLYSWSWQAEPNRRAYAHYGETTARVLDNNVPTMQLSGTLALDNSTFGRIKSLFD